MKTTTFSQKQQIFYRLLKQQHTKKFIQVGQLLEDHFIIESDENGFISYEASARLSEMFKHELKYEVLQRKQVIGRSGSLLFAYRINPNITGTELTLLVPKKYQTVLKLVA